MQRWMHKAAGGTNQRLKPGLATVCSRSKNESILIGHPPFDLKSSLWFDAGVWVDFSKTWSEIRVWVDESFPGFVSAAGPVPRHQHQYVHESAPAYAFPRNF